VTGRSYVDNVVGLCWQYRW